MENLKNFDITKVYRKALLIRSVEQKLLQLFAEGKLFGTVHTCIGQELTGIAVAEALEPEDFIFTNHRCHGHYIARTDDVDGLIAEIMGKSSGICGGRGGSQHICSSKVYSNGVQGGIVPVATGMAFAEKLRKTGNIGVVFIGDGTLGQGVVYESLNILSLWKIPLLIVVENNFYAQSTAQQQNLAGDICKRAEAFGITVRKSNTWKPQNLISDIGTSVRHVRNEGVPLFHQVDTYRLMAHSKGDDSRDPETVASFWKKDPLQTYISTNETESRQMLEKINERIKSAVIKGESAPYPEESPSPDDSFESPKFSWQETTFESNDRIAQIIYESLKRNMAKDSRIFLIGEDIEAPYGGAFKVTRDLSVIFPGRVLNTPISEAAIVGIGNGLALNGMLPVCEIMFGDFLSLAADQLINSASKFQYMYNEQVSVPLIVRTPMGGRRGYGPTHSQSLEKHFLGLPRTQVLAIHNRYDPGKFYDDLFQSIDRPSLVIENKLLYGRRLGEDISDGFILEHTTNDDMPTSRLRPFGDADVTIVCYGGMLNFVEKALTILFKEHDIICEVIVPIRLYPLNPYPIIRSVETTNHLVVVEEGLGFAAFGSEVIAQVIEKSPNAIVKAKRISCSKNPIPCCGPLESIVLPNTEHVIKTVLEITNGK